MLSSETMCSIWDHHSETFRNHVRGWSSVEQQRDNQDAETTSRWATTESGMRAGLIKVLMLVHVRPRTMVPAHGQAFVNMN